MSLDRILHKSNYNACVRAIIYRLGKHTLIYSNIPHTFFIARWYIAFYTDSIALGENCWQPLKILIKILSSSQIYRNISKI